MEQVAPSLFFQFAYLGLVEIESFYAILMEGKKLLPEKVTPESNVEAYLNFLKDKGIRVQSISDLNLMVNYLNQSIEVLCYLYFDNVEKINSEYDQFFSFYVDLQRASAVGKDKKNLIQHFLGQFESKYQAEKELQRL